MKVIAYASATVRLFPRWPVFKRLLVLTGLLLLPLLVACGGPEDSGYRGSLYFIQGSYLMRYNLRDGSLSAVTNLGDKQIREISQFGEDRLLIAETASVNRKRVERIRTAFNVQPPS